MIDRMFSFYLGLVQSTQSFIQPVDYLLFSKVLILAYDSTTEVRKTISLRLMES